MATLELIVSTPGVFKETTRSCVASLDAKVALRYRCLAASACVGFGIAAESCEGVLPHQAEPILSTGGEALGALNVLRAGSDEAGVGWAQSISLRLVNLLNKCDHLIFV